MQAGWPLNVINIRRVLLLLLLHTVSGSVLWIRCNCVENDVDRDKYRYWKRDRKQIEV